MLRSCTDLENLRPCQLPTRGGPSMSLMVLRCLCEAHDKKTTHIHSAFLCRTSLSVFHVDMDAESDQALRIPFISVSGEGSEPDVSSHGYPHENWAVSYLRLLSPYLPDMSVTSEFPRHTRDIASASHLNPISPSHLRPVSPRIFMIRKNKSIHRHKQAIWA